MKNIALVLIFLTASVALASSRQWEDAKVVWITSQHYSAATVPIRSMIAGLPTETFYWIQTSRVAYVVVPEVSKRQLLNVVLYGKIKIAVEGDKAHILDDDGKDVELAVAEKIVLPQGPVTLRKQPNSP
jgi:hypothetical protein